jgi:response regulator RpfG family c-di-GMP phosphodiesterase
VSLLGVHVGNDREISFAPEAEGDEGRISEPWKVLIADDEEEVHRVTKLALHDFTLDGRTLRFLDAHSGHQAVTAILEHPDTAIVLMDVVMESDDAGLRAVETIRNDIGNKMVRIVLRTGQPGQAPASEVIRRYDINDYKEKTELTDKKLFTVIYTSLQLYQDLLRARRTREGLDRISQASLTILRRRMPERLARGALQLLATLLGIDQTTVPARFGGLMVKQIDSPEPVVMAGIGRYADLAGAPLRKVAGDEVCATLAALGTPGLWFAGSRHVATRLVGDREDQAVVYLTCEEGLVPAEDHVLDVYGRNVALALHSARSFGALEKGQRDLIVMLSEAIERRSRETGNHVRRVGEYSRLLARLSGLNEEESDTLLISSALHDAGKIAIPDAILTKPGKLTPEERKVIETHADIGAQMFAGQELPLLKAAMIIAGQHHERWDGLGYPRKLKGEEIHLYGRIVALADVFDALGSHRCYKHAWPMEDVLKALRTERGRHFDPKLVDLFLANIDQFLAINQRLADPAPSEPGAF